MIFLVGWENENGAQVFAETLDPSSAILNFEGLQHLLVDSYLEKMIKGHKTPIISAMVECTERNSI